MALVALWSVSDFQRLFKANNTGFVQTLVQLDVFGLGHSCQIPRLIVKNAGDVVYVKLLKGQIWTISRPAEVIPNKTVQRWTLTVSITELDFYVASLTVRIRVHQKCVVVCVAFYSAPI